MIRQALAAVLTLCPLGALAQNTTPERITEGFGAWEVRCQRSAPADPASLLACEVVQATSVQGQQQPVSQIAIGRKTLGEELTAVIQLPLGMWLPSGAVLDLGAAGGQHAIPILRCLPGGCVGEVPLDETMRAALSDEAITDSALQFEMTAGTPARVPVVHQGFSAAIASLEARLAAQ